jgi:hypothetical protein
MERLRWEPPIVEEDLEEDLEEEEDNILEFE